MSYCTYQDVEALLNITFKENTVPTAAKATEICGWISSELNIILRFLSIDIPVIGTDMYKVLTLKNAQGAAAIIALSYYGNSESVDSSQGAYYKEQYDTFIKDLKANPEVFRELDTTVVLENPMTQGAIDEDYIDDIMIGDEMIS